jgi:DNA topoisomerase-1
MIKRRGPRGEFLGCSGYSIKNEKGEPSCSTILGLDKEGNPLPPKAKIVTTISCEKCGSPMILRDSKRGPFLGCSKYPKCRATKWYKKLEGDELKQVEALVPLLKEEGAKSRELVAKVLGENPTAARAKPINGTVTDIDCDECGKPMTIRSGRRGYFLGCSGYPKCKNTGEVPAKLLEELGVNGQANNNGDGNGRAAGSNGHPEPTSVDGDEA